MELEEPPPFLSCTSFPSSSYSPTSSSRWRRIVKRKLDMEAEEELRILKALSLPLPEMDASAAPPLVDMLAKVEVENECCALRETLLTQQMTIQGLYGELDEERNASSSAANEAMSMILRLQREKAEIMMEARQFKRYAEEKMAHDQQEIALLDDAIYKREQMIHALYYEVQAYKRKLYSYGILSEIDLKELELDDEQYPQIKCALHAPGGKIGIAGDLEDSLPTAKETPQTSGTGSSLTDTLEKGIVTGNSTSPLGTLRQEEFPVDLDQVSDVGGDDSCDRVYTIDAVHRTRKANSEETVVDASIQEAEIKKLYLRLQSLEADRESLKLELLMIQNEKGQSDTGASLELLREIAQNLSKGVVQTTPPKDTAAGKPWFHFISPLNVKLGVPFLLMVGFLFMKNNVHK